MATEIKYESQLPALLQSITGSKKTESVTANTDPLAQVFASAMANVGMSPEQMQALIGSVFQEGAAQVPVLTQAYANAAGARTTGNSGLQLALGDLNKSLSTSAVQAMLQNNNTNRQIAGQAAGGIAGATKTGTTKVAPNYAQLGLMAGGSLLNWADKKFDLTGKAGKALGMGAEPGAVDVASQQAPTLMGDAMPQFGNMSGVSIDPMSAGMMAGPGMGDTYFSGAPDVGSGLSGGFDWEAPIGALGTDLSFGGGDIPTMDWGMGGAGAWDTGGASFLDGMDGLTDWFSFADGGPTNIFQRRDQAIQAAADSTASTGTDTNAVYQQTMGIGSPMAAASAPAAVTTTAPNGQTGLRGMIRRRLGFANGGAVSAGQRPGYGYANGGVIRNRNNMGAAPARAMTPAYTVNSNSAGTGNAQGLSSAAMGTTTKRGLRTDGDGPDDGGNNPTGVGGGGGLGLDSTTVAGIGLAGSLAGIPGIGSALGLANSNNNDEAVSNLGIAALSMINPVLGLIAKGVQAVNARNNPAGAAGGGGVGGIGGGEFSGEENPNNDPTGITGPTPTGTVSIGTVTDEAGNAMPGLSDISNIGGTEGGDIGGPDGGGIGGAGGGGEGAVGGATGDFADGGRVGGLIRGPGTGTSDSITLPSKVPGGNSIQVSNDEFIFPADVVRFYGTDKLQRMLDAVHTPVNR